MSDDDTYEIPLQHQQVFGAGLKRTRVQFVPSSTTSNVVASPSGGSQTSISDFYLKLVLPRDAVTTTQPSIVSTDKASATDPILSSRFGTIEQYICEICKLPLDDEGAVTAASGALHPPMPRPHEASIAHQVCLDHSYPPSHLDRNRKGLAILSSYGWDPDARQGLGASGQGIQFPVKAKVKDDTLGLGLVLPQDIARQKRKRVEKLDAGKVRKLQNDDNKRAGRLREMFYQNDDIQRYLGGS